MVMKEKILAAIVLYNSDFNRLAMCIKSLHGQVDSIVLFDNSPNEIPKDKIELLKANYQLEYIKSVVNKGMPEALNIIIKNAQEKGFEWVLTMNPDTIIPKDMIRRFKSYFCRRDIAIICPQVIDKRRPYMKIATSSEEEFTDFCITSAACTRVEAWKQVGGFDGWLFVDLLDNEFSKKLRLNNWKILKINSMIVDQEFGEIKLKSKWLVDFWMKVSKILNNVNFAKLSYKKSVSYIRLYYTCRNVIYMDKKFKKYGGMDYKTNYNCNTFWGFIICFILPNIIASNNKLEAVKSVLKGIRDGLKCDVVPWKKNPIDFHA